MKKINLGYIGSGPISNFHIPAIKATGFKIVNFYSRKYEKALKFSLKHDICKPEKSLKNFLKKAKKCDAFVISIKTEATPSYIKKLYLIGKPLFVEKPGSLRSKQLLDIKKKTKSKIFFLYNRRYYDSVLATKEFANLSKESFSTVKIPDAVKTINQFKINGCHVIDLLFFIFGDLTLINSVKLKKNIGYNFLLKSKKGFISCLLNWGAPENFEINIYNEANKRVQLRPLENASFFSSMKKIEPTKKYPIRTYVPKLEKEVSCVNKNLKYKPGFYKQYLEIKSLLNNKVKLNNKMNISNLDQAIKVLKIIEKIIQTSKSKL